MAHGFENTSTSGNMVKNRTTESDLILPALEVIAQFGHPDRGLATGSLARHLRARLTPHAEDLTALSNRADDRLSQVIRNLVSHRTLERKGFATYQKHSPGREGHYVLTENGRRRILEASSRHGLG